MSRDTPLGTHVPRRVRWIEHQWSCYGQAATTRYEAECSRCIDCSAHFISGIRSKGGIYWKRQPRCAACQVEYLRLQKNARQQRYRDRHRTTTEIPCSHCSQLFTPQRSTATFCSASCRSAAYRLRTG